METVTQLVDAIGHRDFAKILGVVPSAVSNMKAENSIPAKKYWRVINACAARDLPMPHVSIFSFDLEGVDLQPPAHPAVPLAGAA